MAEIHVEHKRRSIWPWIIAAIVIAILVMLLIGYLDPTDTEVVTPEAGGEIGAVIEPTSSFDALRADSPTIEA